MHSQFTRSPVSREPLLAAASSPGMSARLSESSTNSYDNPGMSTRPGASYASFSSVTSRFGPTASFLPSKPTGPDDGRGSKVFAGPLSNGMEDDDELDDHLHTFTAAEQKDLTPPFDITSWRGWANALTLAVLALALIGLFALYPVFSFYYGNNMSSGSKTSGYNLGGINASGQYPAIIGLPTLIDADTPSDVYTRTGFDNNQWNLVFSDEFNKDGRTFFNGDDPFFEAVDLHYWPTGDFEWYDPSAVTTKDGHLLITITQEPIHDLNFKSGMLQSWNKLCFNKNAYFEASVSLPGTSGIGGFWPGLWAMGNLGRPGYGASTDGMWPYSYDSCDIGTLPNQTYPNGTGPDATLTTGANGGSLSYLPGQRCSACTCAGESHPGPNVGVGRAAPEIDMIEAQIVINLARGEVSQSAQFAPYDDYYQFNNASTNYEQYDPTITSFNTYLGGYYQQAASSLTLVEDEIYYNQVGTNGQFGTFGFEYSSDKKDRSNGYVTWVTHGKRSWTLKGTGVGPNPKTEVGQRVISEEPMTLIFNLGMASRRLNSCESPVLTPEQSNNFQNVDFSHLTFPNYFRVDYIRVYQRAGSDGTIGCDPSDYPTADYIAAYPEVYNNQNLTTWEAAGYTFPKNRLKDTC